jgi:hypothetical protein
MQDRTIWEIKDPAATRASRGSSKTKESRQTEESGEPKITLKVTRRGLHKNPALAFSLSLLIWGAGQIYNGQRKLGALFVLMMANFYAYLVLTILYWNSMITSAPAVYLGPFVIRIALGIVYFAGLLFWLFSALHAYYKATKLRGDRYTGVEIPLIPPPCSLLVPGWGQILNGQFKKGLFFLLFAMLGFLSIPSLLFIPEIWPALETAGQRFFMEWMLVISLILAPIVLLVWLFSIFDAFKVALDDIKKEPIRERIRYTVNRIRMQGLVRGTMPYMKLTLVLTICLLVSLTISYFFFPQRYYVTFLRNVQSQMSQREMVLIPELATRLLETVPLEESGSGKINPRP